MLRNSRGARIYINCDHTMEHFCRVDQWRERTRAADCATKFSSHCVRVDFLARRARPTREMFGSRPCGGRGIPLIPICMSSNPWTVPSAPIKLILYKSHLQQGPELKNHQELKIVLAAKNKQTWKLIYVLLLLAE